MSLGFATLACLIACFVLLLSYQPAKAWWGEKRANPIGVTAFILFVFGTYWGAKSLILFLVQ